MSSNRTVKAYNPHLQNSVGPLDDSHPTFKVFARPKFPPRSKVPDSTLTGGGGVEQKGREREERTRGVHRQGWHLFVGDPWRELAMRESLYGVHGRALSIPLREPPDGIPPSQTGPGGGEILQPLSPHTKGPCGLRQRQLAGVAALRRKRTMHPVLACSKL